MGTKIQNLRIPQPVGAKDGNDQVLDDLLKAPTPSLKIQGLDPSLAAVSMPHVSKIKKDIQLLTGQSS